MDVEFTPRAYSRGYGQPDARLVNMLVEDTPGGPRQSVRISRPGLVSAFNVGTGPNFGLFRGPGGFSGDMFAATASAIYDVTTGANIGTISTADLVRTATSTDQRVFVAGNKAYLWDGTSLAQIGIGVLPDLVDVLYFDSYFIYLTKGSGRFYYSQPNDAANIDGLNFETAEMLPDPLVAGLVNGDLLILFGALSTEIWYATGDPNTPFQRAIGRSYTRGCSSRNTVALADNAAFWIGDDRNVYRSGYVPERISTHAVENALRACSDTTKCTAWSAIFEGHPWYVLNIFGQGTWCYDVSAGDKGEWSRWETYGRPQDVFRGRTAAQDDGPIYLGDDTTNDIWVLTRGSYTDAGQPLRRIASAFAPVESGYPRCNRLTLTCAKGVGNSASASPVVEMRYSDDQGQSWSRWRMGSLGNVGQTKQRIYWQRLGKMRAPGRAFEFRCTDPVLAAFVDIEINGGRP